MGLGAPKALDPMDLANAQSNANQQAIKTSAQFNQINQNTPFGSVSWSGAIGSPDRTMNVSLSPAMQQQLDLQNKTATTMLGQAVNRANALPQTPFSLSGLPQMPGVGDFSGDATRMEQATFDRAKNLMAPQFADQQRSMQTQLANQGIPIGSEAYTRAMDQMARSQNQAYENAALSAVGAGRQEQSRLFGLGQAARQQGLNERVLERRMPYEELAALLGGAPQQPMPQFGQPAQYSASPVDVMSPAMANYNAQMQRYQSNLGGLYGLGSALLGGIFGV